jgi:anti-sigma-K factor RskA
MELSHETLKDLIAPYILGAVSPDEEREIRDHIFSCEECTEEAESFAVVTAALPFAADHEPLPAGFVDRVVARVHESRPATAPAPAPGRSPWYRRWNGFATVATAGLVVVALFAGAILINEHNALEEKQKVLAALLHHENDGIDLQGPADAVGKVVPTSHGSIFVASGMRQPPKAHTYQLWLLKNGTPISAGTFSVKGDLVVLESSRSISGVDGAAITIEPAGGSDHPTTRPITTFSN